MENFSTALVERRGLLARLATGILQKRGPLSAAERSQLAELQRELNRVENDLSIETEHRHAAAFDRWCRNGLVPTSYQNGISAEERATLEARDMSTGAKGAFPGSTSAFLVPIDFAGRVTSALKSYSGMFESATIQETSTGRLLEFPLDDDTAISGELVTEAQQFTSVDVANLSAKTLSTFKYSSRLIKISVELLRDADVDISAYLAERCAVRLGRIWNDHLTNGSGSGQPTGLLTAASVGRVAVGSAENSGSGSAGTLGSTDMSALAQSVDWAYAANGRWMMSSSTLGALRSLVDQSGRPVFPGLHGGGRDQILNRDVIVNANFPSLPSGPSSPPATVTGAVAFGDFARYTIRKGPIWLARLDERFIESGQVAFVMIGRLDGALLHPGAVKLMQNVY